jgi:hypothetical protein
MMFQTLLEIGLVNTANAIRLFPITRPWSVLVYQTSDEQNRKWTKNYLFIRNFLLDFLCSRKKFRGSILSPLFPCVRPSVRPSSYLLNLSSEIYVAGNKCSFRQGLVVQGISYWKVQGHSEHIKKKSNFNISSYNRQKYWHEIFRNIPSVTGNICNTCT